MHLEELKSAAHGIGGVEAVVSRELTVPGDQVACLFQPIRELPQAVDEQARVGRVGCADLAGVDPVGLPIATGPVVEQCTHDVFEYGERAGVGRTDPTPVAKSMGVADTDPLRPPAQACPCCGPHVCCQRDGPRRAHARRYWNSDNPTAFASARYRCEL